MAFVRLPMKRFMVFLPRLCSQRYGHTSFYTRFTTLKEDKYREYVRDLWHRRVLLGPDDPKPRSQSFLWDYEAELFAFGKRLGEELPMDMLRRAFRHASYKPKEIEDEHVQAKNEIENVENNDDLIDIGRSIIGAYVPAYLRYHFRRLPEEGIRTVSAYLSNDSQLAYLARNLGMSDLVLCEEFPASDSIMSNTFNAIVGALTRDSGEERAEYFVQDFVLTELIDLDINEIFYVKNPMKVLSSIMANMGKGQPEARILRQTGVFTVTPTFVIGIYVDGKLMGQSPGETVDIAEDMAARDCLKTVWDTRMEQRLPLSFGQESGRKLQLEEFKKAKNESLKQIMNLEDEWQLIGNAWEDEPFRIEEMHHKFKEEIQPTLGKVYRRRFKHNYYHGSLMRRLRRPFIAPSVKTI